jgi:hypothetical protein
MRCGRRGQARARRNSCSATIHIAAAMPCPVLLMARELDLGGSERQMTLLARALDRVNFIPIVGAFVRAGCAAANSKTPVSR